MYLGSCLCGAIQFKINAPITLILYIATALNVEKLKGVLLQPMVLTSNTDFESI
jgi:hypothetical protein